jgi:hypothetical protein
MTESSYTWIRNALLIDGTLLDFLSDRAAESMVAAITHKVDERLAERHPPKAVVSPVIDALREHPLASILSDDWRRKVGYEVDAAYDEVLERV